MKGSGKKLLRLLSQESKRYGYHTPIYESWAYLVAIMAQIAKVGDTLYGDKWWQGCDATQLGVTTIFDLRNEGERQKAPSPSITGVKTIWGLSLICLNISMKDGVAASRIPKYILTNPAAPLSASSTSVMKGSGKKLLRLLSQESKRYGYHTELDQPLP
jgi:hypothetical protein